MKTVNVTRIKILADAPICKSAVASKSREGNRWYCGAILFADDPEIKRLTKKQLLESDRAIIYLGDLESKTDDQLLEEAKNINTAKDLFRQFVPDEKQLDAYMESTIQIELEDEEYEAFMKQNFKDSDEAILL